MKISEEDLCKRWRERMEKANMVQNMELEEQLQQEKMKQAFEIEEKKVRVQKEFMHKQTIKNIEDQYNALSNDEPGILLGEIVHPLEEANITVNNIDMAMCDRKLQLARKERDEAILIAKCYRDLAERTHSEKHALQHHLESKVEVVRDFWRNKVVEGGSRGCLVRRHPIRRLFMHFNCL